MKIRKGIHNAFYIILGFLSFIAGCIGIVLPILPTVPFFLLTSYCFAKGSERFNRWFLATKIYKKYVEGFARYKAMSIGGELTLLIFVSLMLIVACLMVQDSMIVMIMLPTLELCKYSYFIFKIKTVSKSELIAMKLGASSVFEEGEKS